MLLNAQGKTHNFLIGYGAVLDSFTTSSYGRLLFNYNSVSAIGENRKMPFRITQANISDENGNLLMVSNGCWIADATGDTMVNGSGLNPNSFTNDYCVIAPRGLPLSHGNIFLPYPSHPNKYILFHQTGDYNASVAGVSTELYYSEIDLLLNNGLGAVTTKNQNILNDNLVWGLAACKHANGRDWWIIALKDASTLIHKFLLDSSGINYMGAQNLGFPAPFTGNATQTLFSPDGNKFAYTSGRGGGVSTAFHDVRLFNFDRCSGNFTGLEYIAINDSSTGFSLAFSPDSKYLYHSSFQKIYQFNTDTSSIAASKTTVAVNDVFYSPYPPLSTNFWYMYLAANGKIYISSGNGVVDFHYINYPDSAGMACDVHLHDLHLPCYSFRANVYHPNYYLGCDTTSGCPCLIPTTGINEISQHDFKFKISPNPNNGILKSCICCLKMKR
ncbi:MAG: PD40 domain-containing protein [Bacteroidia bacterium]|nr:PD40 domain-containing protein [Bacteroidia bacterium]